MNDKVKNLSPDQAVELAQIEAEAMESQAVTAPMEAETQSGPSLKDELSGLVKMAVSMLSPAFPSLEKIYTDETIRTATSAIAAVCNKHGWLQDGLMGEYSEEITAAVIILPLAYATYQGVSADMAANLIESHRNHEQTEKPRETEVVNSSGDLTGVKIG